MTMLRVYTGNGGQVVADDIRVSIGKDDAQQEQNDLKNGWKKYNNYMEQQIDLILSANYTDVFEKHPFSFGKVDASFIIRKSLASFAIAV